MFKNILIGSIIMVVLAGIGVTLYSQALPKQPKSINSTPVTEEYINSSNNAPTDNTSKPSGLTGVAAIKAYAAFQFNVSEDKITVVSSNKKDWPDTCLGLPVEDKENKCVQTVTPGYEVTLQIDGQKTTYRGNDAGTNIRVVKGN